jgi:hypothetical protein
MGVQKKMSPLRQAGRGGVAAREAVCPVCRAGTGWAEAAARAGEGATGEACGGISCRRGSRRGEAAGGG